MEAAPGPAEIIAALQTAILVVDPQGRIADVNPAAETAINMSAANLKRRSLGDVIALPSGFDLASDAPFAAFDVDLSRVRNRDLHGDFTASAMPERPGWRLVAIHGAAAAYRMGHRLERGISARAATGVAAMLAHEIKNPLSGIRGAAQLLEQRVSNDDAAMTRLIRTEVDRVTNLVDKMESFTDTRSLEMKAANIHEIIDHARAVALSGFGEALTLVDAYDPSLPAVLVHRDSLIQILLNLLKNAAETVEGDTKRLVRITTAYRHGISIAADSGGGRRSLPIELCVIDDGPGAPAELAEALFDPFVSSKRQGKGLGLALVDKLMREMGGIIQYGREGAPPRTVFRLLLPRAGR